MSRVTNVKGFNQGFGFQVDAGVSNWGLAPGLGIETIEVSYWDFESRFAFKSWVSSKKKKFYIGVSSIDYG